MIYVLMLFVSLMLLNCGGTTYITNQKQFDAAVNCINRGKKMNIYLAGKTFVLKEQVKATAPLYIRGRNATITCFTESFDRKSAIREEGGYYVFIPKSNIGPYSLFYDKKGNIIGVAESVDKTTRVNLCDEVLAESNSLNKGTVVKLPIPAYLGHLKNRTFPQAFGYFDCGWQTVNIIVDKSDDDYFYGKTINKCRTGNFSYDKKSYKKKIRYVIYNAEKRAGEIYYDNKSLYVPQSVGGVYVVTCGNYNKPTPNMVVSSDFSIKGVEIVGFGGIEVSSPSSALCAFVDCRFKNSLSSALRINRIKDTTVKEIIVSRCAFIDCSILTDYIIDLRSPFDGGNQIRMSNCLLTRNSNDRNPYKNPDGGIGITGNAIVTNNVVYNTPRCHLYFNGGVIEARGNVLYNTDRFNALVERNLSSDLGMVYCNHIYSEAEKALANTKHSIQLKENLIYGARAYGGDARGIFIDDGRGDVVCKDNIILNTQIYSIDSRNAYQPGASVRNKYERNIVSSHYRLESGNAVIGDNTPTINKNIVLTSKPNVVSNVRKEVEDVVLDVAATSTCEKGKITVTEELYKIMKQSPAWRDIKRYVRRK